MAGRKRAGSYRTSSGEIIEGLTQTKDGRFRPIGNGSVKFGSDEALAIHRFRQWQQKNGETPIEPLEQSPLIFPASWETVAEQKTYWRNLILNNPKQAAIELDIPYLAHYPTTPTKPQWELAELADFYIANARNKQGKSLAPKWIASVKHCWKEFCKHIKHEHYRDIAKDDISSYYKSIIDQLGKPNRSASWVKTRFLAVKSVISYARKNCQESETAALAKVAQYCRDKLTAPTIAVNPVSFEPADFRRLLEIAEPRERAMMLLGLNAAMRGDVATVKKADIDLEQGTFVSRRHKNGLPRVAKLWQRTVAAIKEYQVSNPHNSPYLFVARTGAPMTGETFRQVFKRLTSELEIDVTFEAARDTAYTIAFEVDSEYAKFLVGHKAQGIQDNYVMRSVNSPTIARICEAIEKHFFG